MEKIRLFWNLAYQVWPPIIRAVEKFGFHDFRQKYLLGHLNANYNRLDLEAFLFSNGFELAKIAWKDPGEVLSMRKIDRDVFQYHIRLFIDGEIRAHYEYSPESHPVLHLKEARFDPETEYYKKLLGVYLIGKE